MNDTYKETGGLRWGQSLWRGLNVSWPFATLRASRDDLRIEMSFLKMWRHAFQFARSDIRALRKTSGVFSVGLRVEHDRTDCPPFILFWTFRYLTLKARLEQLGYEVLDR